MKVVKFNYKTVGASLLLSACASLSMDPPMESQGDTLVKSLNREKLNNVPAIKTIAPSGDLGLSVDMPFGIPFDMNVFEEDVTTEFSDSLNNELGVDINRLVLNNISEFKDWNNFFSNIGEDDTNFVLTQNTLKEDLLEINSEKEILLNKIKEASALIKKNYAEMLILLGEDKSQGESLFNSGCIYIQSLEKTVRNKIDVLNAKDYSLTVDKYEHEIMLSNNKIIDSGKRIRDLNGVKDKIKINIIKDSLVSCNRILSNLGIFMFDPDENFSDEEALSLNNNIINIIDSLSKNDFKNKLNFDLFQCLKDCEIDAKEPYLDQLSKIESEISELEGICLESKRLILENENHLEGIKNNKSEDSHKKEIMHKFLSDNISIFEMNTVFDKEQCSLSDCKKDLAVKLEEVSRKIKEGTELNKWFIANENHMNDIIHDTLIGEWQTYDYKELMDPSDIVPISQNIAEHFAKGSVETVLDSVKKFRHLFDNKDHSKKTVGCFIGLTLCDSIIENVKIGTHPKKSELAEAYYQKSQCLDHIDKGNAKANFLVHLELLDCALEQDPNHQNAINRWLEIYYANENQFVKEQYGASFDRRIHSYNGNRVSNKALVSHIEGLKKGGARK